MERQAISFQKTVADKLQEIYEDHRTPENWGSPSVSSDFFDALREAGFIEAGAYLLTRLNNVGDPALSSVQKFGALGVGITAVVVADRLINHKNREPKHPERRLFGSAMPAVALYTFGAGFTHSCQRRG